MLMPAMTMQYRHATQKKVMAAGPESEESHAATTMRQVALVAKSRNLCSLALEKLYRL